MLKEKNFYKEGLPVNVITADIQEYPIHFHDDIEVVYVLKGTVKLKNGYYTYTLKQGDIFILNDREIHSFYHTDEPNMVMMLQLDLSYFSKYYGNLKNSFFVTDMEDDDDESLEALRGILARIMLEVLKKGYGYEYKIIEGAHNLLANLLANFQYFAMEDGRFVNEAKNMGNKVLAGRLNRITDYMYENYTRRLTLNEIADREHLSIYYLSHVIKEATGLSFQELLSFIRVEESEKLLLGTNKKIGVISEESGFSAIRYYIKYFTKWFGMHPAEYREKYTGRVSSREISAQYTLSKPDDILAAIKHQSKEIYTSYEREQGPALTIVNLDLDEPLKHMKDVECGIRDLFSFSSMAPGAFAFNMLTALNEHVIAAGENYIITRLHRGHSDKDAFSILLYNNNDKIMELARKGLSLEETQNRLVEFQDGSEILIKISGMNGQYQISRYKFSKENILMSYKVKLGISNALAKRERLTSRWATTPTVDFTTVTTVDTLSIQSNLKGFSAELILIDKKG
ncbi:AraC family transcriptional regulator [Sinanaerobacter chloroacetimidivorans]|jgi:AraC-like DNA-binding protein|uniref:Helix-turn-helix transcriptional regulator n=1 Tax=Sinanaerobacter chloroacetimidivorans TaxID=2818044 RepID=A0A8J7VZF1_9FIRM|nr:AraC family transcriptional regulator [Sinanaerobacter chloroacetimidivorans]MBR0597977.1 helix-turn-helix transcriptional regulator [Sinanaerobacter chloroacetimidivorans]